MAKSIKIVKQKGEVFNKGMIITSIETSFDLLRNGEYELLIKRVTSRRSNSQNSMMWMWFACLAQETGSTSQDFHDYYCDKFLSRKITINKEVKTVASGTSGLDTVAMTYFLNQVQADAASEFGVKLPTPEDLQWEQFQDYYKSFMYND